MASVTSEVPKATTVNEIVTDVVSSKLRSVSTISKKCSKQPIIQTPLDSFNYYGCCYCSIFVSYCCREILHVT